MLRESYECLSSTIPAGADRGVALSNLEGDGQADPNGDGLVPVLGRRELHHLRDIERSLIQGFVSRAPVDPRGDDVTSLVDENVDQRIGFMD